MRVSEGKGKVTAAELRRAAEEQLQERTTGLSPKMVTPIGLILQVREFLENSDRGTSFQGSH